MCYVDHPRSEEAVQAGLLIWCGGDGESPMWGVVMDAMKYAQIAAHQLEALEEELLKGPDEGLTSCSRDKQETFPYGSQLAQEYFESVSDTRTWHSLGSIIGLKVSESHPSQHKKENTVPCLRNSQKTIVDFVSQYDEVDPHIYYAKRSGDNHFLHQHKKRLHILFGPPGAGKTSFSRYICSKFASNPQSSSHFLTLLFHVGGKKVAEARSPLLLQPTWW